MNKTWNEIEDPDPSEYREHESLGHWESEDGLHRIEHQQFGDEAGYYLYSMSDPASGRMYHSLAEAKKSA